MVRLDTSHAPFVLLRCIGAVHSDEFIPFFRSHERLFQNPARRALIVDLEHAASDDSTYDSICRLFSWFARPGKGLESSCDACAFVVSSGALKCLVDALRNGVSLEVPSRIFERAHETVRWLRPLFDSRWERHRRNDERGRSEVTAERDADPEPPLGTESSSPATLQTSQTRSTERGADTAWSPYPLHRDKLAPWMRA